ESRRSWIICVTAFSITAISFAAPAITVVGLRSIAEELGGERSVPALAYSLAWLGASFGGIPMGRAAERFGIRSTVIFGSALVAPAAALTFTRAPETAQSTGHRHGSKAEAQVLGLKPVLVFTALCTAGFLCCVPMAMPQGHLVAFCGDMGIASSQGAAMLSV